MFLGTSLVFFVLGEPVTGLFSAPLQLPSEAVSAQIVGFEVEHLSLLKPQESHHWTPPVLDANSNASYLFAWRPAVEAPTSMGGRFIARNVTQVSAVLTLTTSDRATPPVICRAIAAADLSLECGGGTAWGVPATR
jgi:hypothetical protein